VPAEDVTPRVIDEVSLVWGESLRWDDRRQRLYFVDCAGKTLHWLESGEPPLHSMALAGTPTGVVLTEGDELVVCLDEGLVVVDPDAQTASLLATYPSGMHGRANDANADGSGNLVTGTLNVGPGPGALWHFSSDGGWTELDGEFGNTNGPVVVGDALVVGDTVAERVYSYPYDPAGPSVGERRTLMDQKRWGGVPDGATADADGGVWSCVLLRGALARVGPDGDERLVDLPMKNPSDVAFGGPDLDRLYVTSIAVDLGGGIGDDAGRLLALDVGVTGRPEARFALTRP
jgi:sugar lactone lactonase YvrE